MNKEKNLKNKVYRYHPLYIVKPVFRSFLVFAIFFSQELVSIFEGDFSFKELKSEGLLTALFIALGIFLILLLPSIINAGITYFKSEVILSEKTINYRKITFFSKTSKETPLHQITNLNFNRGILDRIFSTVDLHLDIDSTQTADESDYSILLSLEDAEEFKKLFNQYRESEQEIEVFDLDKDSKKDKAFHLQYDYSSREIWRHVFLSSSLFIIILSIAFGFFIFTDRLANFSLLAVLLLIIPFAVDIIKNISQYYAYKVKANEQSITWQSGLFENKEFTISKSNICAIQINQSLLARIFGYYSLDVEVVGVGNDGQELMTLILYKKKEELLKIFKEIFKEKEWKESYRRESKIVGLYKGFFLGLLSMPLLILPIVRSYFWLYLFLVFILILSQIVYSQGRGIRYDGENIEILSAFFSLNITKISVKNIEHIKVIKRPFLSKLGLSKIEFYYKANTGASLITTGYFPDSFHTSFLDNFIY